MRLTRESGRGRGFGCAKSKAKGGSVKILIALLQVGPKDIEGRKDGRQTGHKVPPVLRRQVHHFSGIRGVNAWNIRGLWIKEYDFLTRHKERHICQVVGTVDAHAKASRFRSGGILFERVAYALNGLLKKKGTV
eukprot:scaffold79475_cov51-Attheya_sp.AAC.4